MTATSERFDVEAERRRLGAMTAGELRQRYQEIGGDEARSRNREYLIRRILWMLQAGVYGGLSERAVALGFGHPRSWVADGRTTWLQLDAFKGYNWTHVRHPADPPARRGFACRSACGHAGRDRSWATPVRQDDPCDEGRQAPWLRVRQPR